MASCRCLDASGTAACSHGGGRAWRSHPSGEAECRWPSHRGPTRIRTLSCASSSGSSWQLDCRRARFRHPRTRRAVLAVFGRRHAARRSRKATWTTSPSPCRSATGQHEQPVVCRCPTTASRRLAFLSAGPPHRQGSKLIDGREGQPGRRQLLRAAQSNWRESVGLEPG